MHGRKREAEEVSEAERQDKLEKIAKYNRLKGAILQKVRRLF
jgi:hypothetical protein